MEKLDKVIRAPEECHRDIKYRDCDVCGYASAGSECELCLMEDALEVLKEQNRLISEMSENMPCCEGCEGKTALGERTDKCIYGIDGFEGVIYCAKRGIENWMLCFDRIRALERQLEESEPVVHAHWVRLTPDQLSSPWSDRNYSCSKCGKHGYKWYDRCWSCGAVMDEKVFEPTPLTRLCFGGRVTKRLKQMGVTTAEQLEAMDKQTLHNIPGLGRRSILEIESELRIWREKQNELLER